MGQNISGSTKILQKKDLIFFLILVIIIFGLYWKPLGYDLIWDTKILVNQSLLFLEDQSVWSAFKYGYFQEQCGMDKVDFYYRPVLTASFLIEHKLWGLSPRTLRLTNLLIYIISLFFLYLLLKRQSEKGYFPEMATALFALYPLNVDNIMWVVGRGDLLLFLWGALALLFLDLSFQKKRAFFLACSSLVFLIGILSKESFLFFLPLLLIYEWIKQKRITVPYHLTNFVIVLLFFVLKNAVLGIKNLGVVLFSNPAENITAPLAALGYYFRSMVFPFAYDMFRPIREAVNPFHIVLGSVFVLALLFFLLRAKRDRELLFPLSLMILFIAGHLVLLYTTLFPFKMYSRYMMIPALGFIWILARYLSRMTKKTGLILVLALSLSFIPPIILNTQSYKDEISYFKRASKSSPNNGYILFQLGNVFHEKRDYFSAELALNRTLSSHIRKETAMLVSLLYADIHFTRAEYKRALKWLGSIEEFESIPGIEIAPFISFQVNHKKSAIYVSQGETEKAEALFMENMENLKNIKASYTELYNMYIGYNLWDKAENLERKMKARFPSFHSSIDTSRTRDEFLSLSPEGKIAYFIRHRNFAEAINIVQQKAPLDLNHRILLAKLFYWHGKEEKARSIIDEIAAEYPNDFMVLNGIGNFYLKDFLRAKEALIYFNRSLEINKNQPEVVYLVNHYTQEYLNKLQEVWPEEALNPQ